MASLTYSVPNARWPNLEVVGESQYESVIRSLLGGKVAKDQEREVMLDAHLVPEPDNPYDKNAISVRVSEAVIGYLGRDDAKAYKQVVHRVAASGIACVVQARLWGVLRQNWEGSGSKFYCSVRVALPEPSLVLPLNAAPDRPYLLLPWGGGLQVVGEDAHFEQLRRYVPKEGRGLLLVSLQRKSEPRARNGDREFVEVQLDGTRVGELSTATSKHFFPLIDHASRSGREALAWAHIKGSQLAAELVLQAAKASEVDASWLGGQGVQLPAFVPEAAAYSVPPAYSGPPRAAGNTTTSRSDARSNAAPTAPRGRVERDVKLTPTMASQAKGGCAGVLVVAALGITAVLHASQLLN